MEKADNILFRCSGLGYIMTAPRAKSESLSDTTKTNLIDIFVSEKYGRREEITSKFLEKGNQCEEDGITLLSRLNKRVYKKNEIHLSNGFIKGTPDLFEGGDIFNAEKIIDTKLSWSAHTFFRAKTEALNKMYYWQMQGYMWLSGATSATIAYCLVNGTQKAIEDEKRRLSYSVNPESDLYFERAKQIEINHIFDLELFQRHNPNFIIESDAEAWTHDILMSERLHKVEVKRNDEDIELIKIKVIECRNWMNNNLFNYGKN